MKEPVQSQSLHKCNEDYSELYTTTDHKETINYNKENQQYSSGNEDSTESDYVILEQPVHSPS